LWNRKLTIFLFSIFFVVLVSYTLNFGSKNLFQANNGSGDGASSSSNTSSPNSKPSFDPNLPPQLQPVPTSSDNQNSNRNPFAPNLQQQLTPDGSIQNPNAPGVPANPESMPGNEFGQDNQPCWVRATVKAIGQTNVLVVETNAVSREGYIWAVASGFSPELYFGFEQTGKQSLYTRSIFQTIPNDPKVTLYSSKMREPSNVLCESF
jgi:hypothetical protein